MELAMWPFSKKERQKQFTVGDYRAFKAKCKEIENCLSPIRGMYYAPSQREAKNLQERIVVLIEELSKLVHDTIMKDECIFFYHKIKKIKDQDWYHDGNTQRKMADDLLEKLQQWARKLEKEQFAFTELDKNHVNIKGSLKIESVSHDAYLNKQMRYFEVPVRVTTGKCSDKDCPCPETSIPYGSGYLYISQNLVDFRQDALTVKALEAKIERLGKFLGSQNLYYFGPGVATPILMCEQAAKLRNLDLKAASSDANYWWKTGLVPLRATPIVPDAKKDQYKTLSNLLIFENDEFLKAYQCRNCLKTFSSDELTNKIWQKCPVCQEEHIATKPSITCPGCKRAIWIPIGKEGILTCPFCTNQFQINTISDKQK